MLQRPQPPTQLCEVGLSVLVRQRVDDVFNFRGSFCSDSKSRNHDGKLSMSAAKISS